jgi:hypothetical protein
MNTQEIAQKILERRNRMNPVVMSGEMLADIGSDGMSEALQRRWLVPSTETGHLQVSTDMAVVEEMRTVAAMPAPEFQPVKESACHGFAVSHSERERGQLTELMAPMTGHDNSAPFRPQAPASPTTSAPPPGGPIAAQGAQGGQGAPGIGDEVIVAENGKDFTGTIGTVGQDGKYKVTFGNLKPPVNRDYGVNEFKVTKKATPA